MQIYLPIAEQSVNAFLLLGLGGGVGVLSGLFGVGGGFLMTPLLIFIGIPPAVAVATEANQIVASSFSGVLAHLRRRTVDIKMGLVLMAGGGVGSVLGVQVFKLLRELGQVELLVSLCYVVFLGVVGGLMFIESVNALRKTRKGVVVRRKKHQHGWIHGLPLKMRFRQSNLYISAIPPFLIGLCVGILAAIMGVGGGFIMVPAMIYLLGMPTAVVVGTSLFQIIFVTGLTTILHATQNQTVDAALAVLLLLGGVVGAQIGAQLGVRIKGEQLRVLLAMLVLIVCIKLGYDLVATPTELFSLGERADIDPPCTFPGFGRHVGPGGRAARHRFAQPERRGDHNRFQRVRDFVYGAIERQRAIDDRDTNLGVIITVFGPSSPVTVRKKDRVFGIWANAESAVIDSAPSFYALASTGPLVDILSDASNSRANVTVDNSIHIAAGPRGIADPDVYREAVIRLNRDRGVYFDMIGEVEMVGKTLFQTHISLPANLVEGNYTARIFLTKDGEVIDDFQTGIRVRKVGLERWIYNLAHENSLIYGLLSILVALMAGWGASEMFRLLRR